MIEKHSRGADTRRREGGTAVTPGQGADSLLTSPEASSRDTEVTEPRPGPADTSPRGLSTQSF